MKTEDYIKTLELQAKQDEAELKQQAAENELLKNNVRALCQTIVDFQTENEGLKKELRQEKDGYSAFAEVCCLMVEKAGGRKALLELKNILRGQDNEKAPPH